MCAAYWQQLKFNLSQSKAPYLLVHMFTRAGYEPCEENIQPPQETGHSLSMVLVRHLREDWSQGVEADGRVWELLEISFFRQFRERRYWG